MNKAFNIVWSHVRQAWIVTSELTTRNGTPFRATAGILPVILFSAMVSFPAQAEYTEEVTSGITVTGENVPEYGYQVVDGGTTINTTLNNGRQIVVGTGSQAIGTVINYENYFDAPNVNGCSRPNCVPGQEVSDGGVATDTIVNTGMQQIIAGGRADNTVVNNEGTQSVKNGGYASGTIINDNGLQWVGMGGSVSNAIINGGTQEVYLESKATNTTVNAGGKQEIKTGSTAQDTILNGGQQIITDEGSVANGTIIYNGGQSIVQNSATANKTTINTGGEQIISSDSTASETVINGGKQIINTGGNAYNTAVNSGGNQTVQNGAYSHDVKVNRGGILELNGGTAEDVTIDSGGIVSAHENSAMQGTLTNGGQAIIHDSVAINGDVLNRGTLSFTSSQPVSAALINGNLSNSGTLFIGDASSRAAGSVLTVQGDYHGDGGSLLLNTVLGTDNSATDKFVIGGNVTGTTDISVNNLGGKGDQTLNGIEIVKVAGSSAAGAFYNSKAIRAGLYNYTVIQKGNNYYLTSDYVAPEPEPTPEPTPAPGKDISTSAGGYMANLAAANQVFITRLADRQTSMEYLNTPTDNAEGTSLWLRQVGGHTRSRADVLRTRSNRYVAQIGGEILAGTLGNADRWAMGLMAGYADQNSTTTSVRSRYNTRTTSSLRGYSVGLYGTWMEDAKDNSGLYLDAWVQYSWFHNSVNEAGQASDSYSSKGFSASAEGGYAYKLSEGKRTDFYIQPQMQLVWSGISADGHHTRTGIYVQDEGNANIQSRIGIKAYLKGHSRTDDKTGREFKPFVEANWIHNTARYGVRMSGDQLTQDGAKNISELKTGIEANLASSISLWGGIGVQIGEKGYSDTQGQLGIRYRF